MILYQVLRSLFLFILKQDLYFAQLFIYYFLIQIEKTSESPPEKKPTKVAIGM